MSLCRTHMSYEQRFKHQRQGARQACTCFRIVSQVGFPVSNRPQSLTISSPLRLSLSRKTHIEFRRGCTHVRSSVSLLTVSSVVLTFQDRSWEWGRDPVGISDSLPVSNTWPVRSHRWVYNVIHCDTNQHLTPSQISDSAHHGQNY